MGHARRRTYQLLEQPASTDRTARAVHAALLVIILVNVGATVISTVEEIGAAAPALFATVERVTLVLFAVEYVARLWSAVENPLTFGRPAWQVRLRYALTPYALVDFFAIAPFVLVEFTDINLKVLVLLRLLRFLKLARYSTGFQALFEAMRREREALLACLVILMSVVLIAASAMYAAEREVQPDSFGSIPAATWWAITTVTTVGYGDVVPATTLGRLIGGITMIGGLVMLALPIAIIATAFAEVIQRRSFVVTAGMVGRSPLFAGLDAASVAELVPMIRAMTVDTGEVIIDAEGSANAVYVVADGEVEIDHPQGARRVGVGDAFGALPHRDDDSNYPARAVTRVRLLTLEVSALKRALARIPESAADLGAARKRRETESA